MVKPRTGGRADGRRMPRGRKEGIRIAGGFAQQMAAPLAAQMEGEEGRDGRTDPKLNYVLYVATGGRKK